MSMRPRLSRLFAPDGKCFDVAIDHGLFNEYGFLSGIEDIQRSVDVLVDAAPDAIQLTVGQARLLQDRPGKNKPALVLRTDLANVYGRDLPRYLFSRVMDDAVEQALTLDAAAVVVNLLLLPEQPELHRQCIDNICRLKPICERYGMPLMVEPLIMQPNDRAGGYMVDGDTTRIVALVRQAVELGADIVKADPTDTLADYHRVVETASGRPVLVRGGGRVADVELLARTAALMEQGASGIVYGRNIIQHPNPQGITRALMAVVHGGVSATEAGRHL